MTEENSKSGANKIGPWQRLSQREVYANPWILLTHEEVITPGGNRGIYGKVHFKHLAIGIVPLDADHNTILVGQHRYTLDEFSWEIPMGGGALDEDPLISAQRELKEETGLYGGEWRQLMRLHTSNSVTDEEGYVFLACKLQQGSQELGESESDLILKALPLADALSMIERGEITDLISIAALLAVEKIVSK